MHDGSSIFRIVRLIWRHHLDLFFFFHFFHGNFVAFSRVTGEKRLRPSPRSLAVVFLREKEEHKEEEEEEVEEEEEKEEEETEEKRNPPMLTGMLFFVPIFFFLVRFEGRKPERSRRIIDSGQREFTEFLSNGFKKSALELEASFNFGSFRCIFLSS